MGLVATMKDLKETSGQELNRYSENRPLMVDGSLSEIVTQALNLIYTKKNLTTGDPFYGKSKADGEAPNGAGGVPNILQPDSPTAKSDRLVRPSLESQQMFNQQIEGAAAVLADAISINDSASSSALREQPLMIYAIPEDKKITEEMNDNIEMYADSGGIKMEDFIFVTTDTNDTVGSTDYRVVDASARIGPMVEKGAKVYPDLMSFLNALPDLRRKR